MEDFKSMDLPESILNRLGQMGFIKPTPIQVQAIPLALQGQDILASAQTGTGKTLAFGIPAITRLIYNPDQKALIMTPTRELAFQVMRQLESLIDRKLKLHSTLLIGGEPMRRQLQGLSKNPQLIIGTPGRIYDHLNRGSLRLDRVGFLVLDETDRMLDMGFSVQIEAILPFIKKEHQTLLFSATLPKNIIAMTNKYLQSPARVAIEQTLKAPLQLKQDTVYLKAFEKYNRLVEELEKREGSILVFVRTKGDSDKIAQALFKDGQKARAIHGDLQQNKRNRVMLAFRKKEYRVLVATDIASRGLDVPHIEHVINYDLPQVPEDYIHRIGRTARAGALGSALNFVSPNEQKQWQAIEALLDPEAFALKRNKANAAKRGPKKNGFKNDFKGRSKGSFRDDFQAKKGFSKFGSFNDSNEKSRGRSREGGFSPENDFKLKGDFKKRPFKGDDFKAKSFKNDSERGSFSNKFSSKPKFGAYKKSF